MNKSPDEWLAARQYAADPLVIHAVGWIAIRWTVCEQTLEAVFAVVLGVNFEVGRAITHKLGCVTISNSIRDLLSAKAAPEGLIEHVDDLLKHYDICRQNRNIYVHSGIEESDSGPQLIKRSGFRGTKFTLDARLSQLREICDEIEFLSGRMVNFVYLLMNQPDFWRVSLPEKPTLPKLRSTPLRHILKPFQRPH